MTQILLVGSDGPLLEGLAQSLAAMGHTPRVATSIAEAQEAAAAAPPLILLASRFLLGDGGAQAAIDAANAAYSAAETDLHEAERREKRARTKLKHAEDDMRDARKDGQDAADDAQTTGLLLQGVLRTMPASFHVVRRSSSRWHVQFAICSSVAGSPAASRTRGSASSSYQPASARAAASARGTCSTAR